MRTGARVLSKSRFGNEALGDISNLGNDGEILQSGDRKRAYSLGNRLWHTDASFQDPPGRYSMLSAKVVPPKGADTEYADLRGAYDALPAETKAQIADLKAHHSIAYSRQVLGFEFSQEEEEALKGAIHPLVRTLPRSNRKSLYVASHASRIIDWPIPEGRLLLRDLIEHATQRQFVYRHSWRVGDLVISGQPVHDAPSDAVRGHEIPSRASAGNDARYARACSGHQSGLSGPNSTPRPSHAEGEPPINTRLAGIPLARRTRCPRHSRLPARRSQREPARSPQRREHRARAARAVSSSSYPLPRSWSSHRARRVRPVQALYAVQRVRGVLSGRYARPAAAPPLTDSTSPVT